MERDLARPTGVSAATRRTVVGALLSMPVVAWFARHVGSRADAASQRPLSVGVSGGCCAVCGSGAHSMLSCPESPRVV